MRKQASSLEWSIVENDGDWARISALPLPGVTPVTIRRLRLKHYFWLVAAPLLLLASVGGGWWHTTPIGAHPPIADGMATTPSVIGVTTTERASSAAGLIGKPADSGQRLRRGQGVSESHLAIQNVGSPAYVFDAVQTFEVQGDLAVARVVMYTDHGEPAYRQTRFYQRIGPDWRQMTPDAALWGPKRSLETPSFIYHFRQNDAAAVIAVAPQVEALYATLRQDFGLPDVPSVEKLVIEVSVTHPPRDLRFQPSGAGRAIVASPAIYPAPMALTDADLLAQSIFLPLLKQVIVEARERNAISAHWKPILDGLRLWHVWETDLPLSGWREHIIPWIYLDLPGAPPEQPFMLPEQYAEICASHTLWLAMPVQLGIPLFCAEIDETALLYSMWGRRHPPTQLSHIALPTSGYDPDAGWPIFGQTVALATLIEYAVATYGRERLPVLVAGLGQYDTWETLLPAVYGVSAAEFEAGWQGYLSAHGGVSLDILMQ